MLAAKDWVEQLLLAAVHGLQRQVCATFDPMPVTRARELLAIQVRVAQAGPLRLDTGGVVPRMVERSDWVARSRNERSD